MATDHKRSAPVRGAGVVRRPPPVAGEEFRFSPRPNRAHEIEWRPWGAAVFAAARDGRKPLLLSISAVWCHWCHVMDETSFSDPAVIAAVNERFVAVRVDNDRRPDVNRRYNMGGWPTIAFLTHRGDVLSGGTYMPPGQLLSALEQISGFYALHEADLDRGGLRRRSVPVRAAGPAGPAALRPQVVAGVVDDVAKLYDPLHAGLGLEPKFPQADALSLLLTWGLRHGDERRRDMALATLRAMDDGQIHDHVEQGFFRYATRRDWSLPHYEKMLEDNAKLALLYLDAFAATGESRFGDVAAGTIDYLASILRRDEAPFYAGSQDADERYFRLDATGRAAFDAVPAVDTTVYVEWNALAARALLRASYLLDRDDLAETALQTLVALWERAHTPDGMRRHLDGAVTGLLGDQAAMLSALVDAAEVSGQNVSLMRAQVLADWILEHLVHVDGRFVDRRAAADDSGGALHGEPLPVIDGGAETAEALLRLAALCGRNDYREKAAKALAAYAQDVRSYGAFAAPCALAVMRCIEHPLHVAVVGRRADERTSALRRAALALREPLRSVATLDPRADHAVVSREGYSTTGPPVAYVCASGACSEPVTEPDRLAGVAAAVSSVRST
jgi:uncharacterized protein